MSHTTLDQNARFSPQSTGPSPGAALLLQRKCACGGSVGLAGECEECRKKRLQAKLTVGVADDAYEREADRVADAVVLGNSSPSGISSVPSGGIQREEAPKQPTDEEKYKEGAKKVGEAFLETPFGKQLLEQVKQDKLVKGATAFIDTLPGKIVTGAVATGAVSALAAAHKELPAQIPEIPLDAITPGLSVKITYNGPVDKPTDASISFKFTEQIPKPAGGGKPAMSPSEKYRAETARLAADLNKFKAGLKYPPGSPEDLRQKAEDEAIKSAASRYSSGPDVDAIIKKYPGLGKPAAQPGLQLTPPAYNYGYQPPSIFGDQFKYTLPGEQKAGEPEKKKEDAPVQRKASGDVSHREAPASVDKATASAGRPLDQVSRNFMERRFGHDFSQVRIHDDTESAASAKAINASAYTVGKDIVFGTGQFAPDTAEGKRLLAHELTHVVQQQASHSAGIQRRVTVNPGVAAANDILNQFRFLCPSVNFALSGRDITADSSSVASQSCECLTDVASDSSRTYTINVDTVANSPTNVTLYNGTPATIPNPTSGPRTTPGTNPVVYMPASAGSAMEFGAFSPAGAPLWCPNWRILGHELCGHGRLNQNCEAKGDRPSHDATIDTENTIASEHGGPARGHYTDGRQGESFHNPTGNRARVVYKLIDGWHFEAP